MRFLTGLSTGIWGYVAAAVVAAGLSGYAVHRWDASTIAEMKLADDQATISGLQDAVQTTAALAANTNAVALALAGNIGNVTYLTNTIIREVPKYVTAETDARYPVPCGVIRVRDAAALQVDPSELESTACPSDDSKSQVTASTLSSEDASVIGSYYKVEAERAALAQWADGVAKILQEQAQRNEQ